MTTDDATSRGDTRDELNGRALAAGVKNPEAMANKAEVMAAIEIANAAPPPETFDPVTIAPETTIEYTDEAGDQVSIYSGSSGEVTPRNGLEAAILASHAVGPAAKAEAAAAEEDA